MGATGHAESVKITYDPSQVTFGRLLKVFFAVAHDPTQLNRQGPDEGTQYRSSIFYANDEQKAVALAYIQQLAAAGVFRRPIVTKVAPLEGFYPAEAYHQHFLERNPTYPYIVYNDLPKLKHLERSKDEQLAVKTKQGFPLFGVDMKVVGPDGTVLPHDGASSGELHVRGPWIVSAYYNDDRATAAAFDADGWFRTGDVSTIDADGYMIIVDRSKDVIKSGGEWISSIDVENAAMGHPDVAEAAVIGLPHPKWDERPLLIVVPKAGRQPSKESITAFLGDKIAKWQLPDDVVFVPEIPHGATGKVLKARLREQFKDYRLPTA